MAIPFDEDLFSALGIKDMPDEEKASLLARMLEIVQTRVFDKIYDLLSTTQQDEFVALLEDADPDVMQDYLQDHIPGYEKMYEDEGRILRQELILKLAQ